MTNEVKKSRAKIRIEERQKSVTHNFKLLRKRFPDKKSYSDQSIIDTLAEDYNVDPMTIRRDLQKTQTI